MGAGILRSQKKVRLLNKDLLFLFYVYEHFACMYIVHRMHAWCLQSPGNGRSLGTGLMDGSKTDIFRSSAQCTLRFST